MFKKVNKYVVAAYREGIETIDKEIARLEEVMTRRPLGNEEQMLFNHLPKSRAKLESDNLIYHAKRLGVSRRIQKQIRNEMK